jgi:hypothetical protein
MDAGCSSPFRSSSLLNPNATINQEIEEEQRLEGRSGM